MPILLIILFGDLESESQGNLSSSEGDTVADNDEQFDLAGAVSGAVTNSIKIDTASTSSSKTSLEESDLYLVTKVVDGDTITVSQSGSKDGEKQTVRLIGIDTPETVHPTKPVQCFGLEASNKMKELVDGKEVRLEFDVSQGEQDAYGRTLAYIFLPDDTFVNEYLIRNGYAYEYTYDSAYKYQARFKKAQKDAELGQKGLWAPGACEEERVPVPVTQVISSEPDPEPVNQSESQPEPEIEPKPMSETQQPDPEPVQLSGSWTCSYNAYNCDDFSTHSQAQSVYESCGGVTNDIHQLDRDKDGLACESLP